MTFTTRSGLTRQAGTEGTHPMNTVISPAKPSAPGVTRPGPRRWPSAGAGVARHRDALRTPGALAFAIPGVIGRMPMAMLSLALVMLATAALAACAAGRAPVWALFVTGGLSRATMPSLGPMVRSRWSGLLGSALLDAAFSLEGIADELIFITGPVLVVALAAGFTPVAGVLVTA